jgi:hypothetical protein
MLKRPSLSRAHRAVSGAVVAALVCIVAPAALGTARWHGPTQIGPVHTVQAAALASHGEALAAWITSAPSPGGTLRWQVQVKVRHGARSPWHGPITIARTSVGASPPLVALNDHGDALVLWRPAGQAVQVASRNGWRGRWRLGTLPSGPPIAGDPTYEGFAAARVALAPDGAAAVLWATVEHTGIAAGPGRLPARYVIRGARRAGRTGAWRESPPLALEPVADIGFTILQPHLAVDAAGDAAALWLCTTLESIQGTPPPGGVIQAARRTGDGAWGAPVTLAEPAGPGDVAIAPNGRAAAVWQERAASYGLSTPIALALGEPGGRGWSQAQAGPGVGRQPAVAVNSRGDVLVGWGDPPAPLVEDDHVVVHAAIRPAGAAWGAAGTSSALGLWADLRPLIDEVGRGYVQITDTGGTEAEGRGGAAMVGSAAGWPAAGRVGGFGDVALAAGPDGTAVFLSAWPQLGLYVAGYDGSPIVRVATRVHGRWDARARLARWTLRVRNAGRGRALGVSVSVGLGEARLARARPRARASRERVTWRLGRMAPGAVRTLTLALRERPTPKPGAQLNVRAFIRATQMAEASSLGTLRVPRS